MLFRLVFLCSIPFLSDDFYRFIWDGKLSLSGINPYLHLPSEIINTELVEQAQLSEDLYNKLNSPNYYSVYPSLNQVFFMLGAVFFKFGMLPAIIALRVPIIIAEFILIKYLRKLLKKLQVSQSGVLWYALNPLVIVELSGNLHYEGVMLCFLVLALYYIVHNNWGLSAVVWALSVSTKLLPLMFLPTLIKKLGIIKSLWFYLTFSIVLTLTFIPFINTTFLYHIYSSVNLYFQTFEFNASIYNVVKFFGYKAVGYNIIQTAGPVLMSIATFIILILYAISKKTWVAVIKAMLLAYTFYLFLSTTVHPWYIVNLVLLSAIVQQYKFALLWSFLVVLSYAAYQYSSYAENYWLLAIEYVIVISYLAYEFNKYRKLVRA